MVGAVDQPFTDTEDGHVVSGVDYDEFEIDPLPQA